MSLVYFKIRNISISFNFRSLKLTNQAFVIADEESNNEDTIDAGEGNDSANIKSLLKPENRDRRRRDAPTETTASEDEPQFPDAQGVSNKKISKHLSSCSFLE